MKITLLIAFLLSSLFSVQSRNIKFHSINNFYGTSIREVASLCKDKNGFIWASSKTGVHRLTGDDFRAYSLPYDNKDVINVKLLYSNSGLLAYTNNGQLFKYNTILDRFDLLVSMTKSLNNKYLSVGNVLEDNSGRYWIATSFGLYVYKGGRFTFIDKVVDIDYLAWKDTNHLLVARSEGIWLLDIRRFKGFWISKYNNMPGVSVSRLLYDKLQERLWIGTHVNGIYYCDMKTRRMHRVLGSELPIQPVLAFEFNSDSTILAGIDGQGIWEINKKGTKVLNVYKEDDNDITSLRGNGVYDIFNDHDGRVWVCTFTGGISFYDKASPQLSHLTHITNNTNSLTNDNVNKIVQTKSGNIWFATNNGLSCKESKTGKWRTFYHNKGRVFVSLCEDDKGRVWAGAYSAGLYVLDDRTGNELAHYAKEKTGDGFNNNFVMDIFKDRQGNLWMGGVGGGNLTCYIASENRFRSFFSFPVYAISELSDSQLLLGCTYGLCIFDKKTGWATNIVEGYLVQDILVLRDNIWICTAGEGLLRYNLKSHKITKIGKTEGLTSDYVNSIIYSNGYLWLGTESGLCKLDPNSLKVLTYNSVYPLSRLPFNANSNWQLSNGELIWGTSNGAIHFSPGSLTERQSKGGIFFQYLSLSGRSVQHKLKEPLDSLKTLSLNYNQNTLHLELLSIGTVIGAKFSWKVEELDNDWNQPSENRFIHYSNMPSGKYLLKIRLYNSSLSKIIAERSLTLKVVPPFWKAWWFIILLSVIIIGMAYFLLNYYIDRIKQQHTEEKVRFFTNTAHDIRTSLTLIKGPIEELYKEQTLSDAGHNYLSLASEQTKRLSNVVTQLMDFQKIDIRKEQLVLRMKDIVAFIERRCSMYESLAKSQNIELHFQTEFDSYFSAIDESLMDKVVDNLISNAIKYSHHSSHIYLLFSCTPDDWTLSVQDDGIGISRKAQQQLFKEFYRGDNAINSKIVGSGIGLLLAKKYVEMHNGKISCVSEENIGSTFKIVIPFKEVVKDNNYIDQIEAEQPTYSVEVSEKEDQSLQAAVSEMMQILIVEDNDDLRKFMKYSLQSDFNVLEASNGDDAWDIIQRIIPDMIISDIMMPKMDGFELCQLIKSVYETSHIPVLLLTALSGKAEQLKGLGLGADDYLTKPFDMQLLRERIRSIIRNRVILKERTTKLMGVSETTNEPILANENNDKFIKKMLDVVQNNMTNVEFSKDDFASAMNVSASLLYKKSKSLTGQSPTDFIKTVRLDYALKLIRSKKYNITEVSELSGFSSIGYFSTVFKKHFGKPPTAIEDFSQDL